MPRGLDKRSVSAAMDTVLWKLMRSDQARLKGQKKIEGGGSKNKIKPHSDWTKPRYCTSIVYSPLAAVAKQKNKEEVGRWRKGGEVRGSGEEKNFLRRSRFPRVATYCTELVSMFPLFGHRSPHNLGLA